MLNLSKAIFKAAMMPAKTSATSAELREPAWLYSEPFRMRGCQRALTLNLVTVQLTREVSTYDLN